MRDHPVSETTENKMDNTRPIQAHTRNRKQATIADCIHMAAYEVYCEVHGPQEALITGWCRGGFGIQELVAFLYAKPFPKNEWRSRVNEAFKGMNID